MSRYDVEVAKWNEKAAKALATQNDWDYTRTYDSVFGGMITLRPVYSFFDRISAPGVVVLDYGCGRGWATLALAQKAEKVKAFDISEGQIAILRKYAEHNGFPNIEARVADGEALPYADEEFDYVFGNAVLHHLRLDKCLPEIARVLKPGGRAAFSEPLAHNPLVNAFRYVKHHFYEAHLGTDRPLRYSDIAVFEKYFSRAEFRESSFFRGRFRGLDGLDRLLLRVPFLRRFVAYAVVLLWKAERTGQGALSPGSSGVSSRKIAAGGARSDDGV